MTKPAQEIIDAFERGEDTDLQIHPAAEVFPRVLKKELEEMAEDIKKRGLKESITLHPDGSILDGRNRFKACRLSGQKPRFRIWKGRLGEEVDFVVTSNLRRRHLNEPQRSIVAAKLAKLKRGRPEKSADLPELTQREAAAALKVSERNTRKARKIMEEAPENIGNLVAQGMLSVSAGEAVARASLEDKERIAAMTDDEAVAEAKRLAKKSARHSQKEKSAVPGKPTQPDAAVAMEERTWSLIDSFGAFLAHWRTATGEDRAQLNNWLKLEANSGAFESLKALATLALKPTSLD
jgi:hypothetical protein